MGLKDKIKSFFVKKKEGEEMKVTSNEGNEIIETSNEDNKKIEKSYENIRTNRDERIETFYKTAPGENAKEGMASKQLEFMIKDNPNLALDYCNVLLKEAVKNVDYSICNKVKDLLIDIINNTPELAIFFNGGQSYDALKGCSKLQQKAYDVLVSIRTTKSDIDFQKQVYKLDQTKGKTDRTEDARM